MSTPQRERSTIELQLDEAYRRIAELDERVDLLETPFWRRWLFYLNGWPRRPVPATEQKWRFWHRWRGRRDR